MLVIMMKFFTPSEFIDMVNEYFDTLIFDLDNTIYDENIFLFDRYRAISDLVAGKDLKLSQASYDYLCRNFLAAGRTKLFDRYLENFDKTHTYSVDDLLFYLRLPPQHMIPFDYFYNLMQTFGGRFFLVTNGNPLQQRNKISALAIADVFDGIIMANEVEKKPSKQALLPLLLTGQLGRVVYVGDTDVDHSFALNCKIPFIRINFDRNEKGLVDQNTIIFSGFI